MENTAIGESFDINCFKLLLWGFLWKVPASEPFCMLSSSIVTLEANILIVE